MNTGSESVGMWKQATAMRLCYGVSARAQPSPGLSFPSVHEAVGLDQWFSPEEIKKYVPVPRCTFS